MKVKPIKLMAVLVVVLLVILIPFYLGVLLERETNEYFFTLYEGERKKNEEMQIELKKNNLSEIISLIEKPIYLKFNEYPKTFYLDGWTFNFSDYCPIPSGCAGWATYTSANIVVTEDDIDWFYRVCVHEKCHNFIEHPKEEEMCGKYGDNIYDKDCFKLFAYILVNSRIEKK